MCTQEMFCGAGSFKHVDEDGAAAATSPRVAKRKSGKSNPYSSLGLDKFSTVLSELESRRSAIMQRVGSGGPDVIVRFVQSEAHGWVPIVVKLPEGRGEDAKTDAKKQPKAAAAPAQPPPPSSPQPTSPKEDTKPAAAAAPEVKKLKKGFSWGKTRPSCYWPFVMVLVLVSLVVFGRMFAICCTSIWWYLVPTLSKGCEEAEGARRSMAKSKDYVKKVSDKKTGDRLAAPPPHAKKSSGGVHEVLGSPRSFGHGKKGN